MPSRRNVTENDSPGSRFPLSNSVGPDWDRMRWRSPASLVQVTVVPGATTSRIGSSPPSRMRTVASAARTGAAMAGSKTSSASRAASAARAAAGKRKGMKNLVTARTVRAPLPSEAPSAGKVSARRPGDTRRASGSVTIAPTQGVTMDTTFEIYYRLQHRHKDGSWGEMEEVRSHHGAAAARQRAQVGYPPDVPLQHLRRVRDDRPARREEAARRTSED